MIRIKAVKKGLEDKALLKMGMLRERLSEVMMILLFSQKSKKARVICRTIKMAVQKR